MGKTLQICAVAVLIIIAVPIVVGFALPGEESERTYWDESESHSLTDALRNGSEDYYVMSSSVSNNRWLLDGSDAIVTPDYVQVSSTRTALENVVWSAPSELAASSTSVKNESSAITVTPSDGTHVYTGVDTIDVGADHIQRGDKYLTVVAGPTPDKTAVDVWYHGGTVGDWRHASGPTAVIDRDGSAPVNITTPAPSVTLTDAFTLTVPAYDGSYQAVSWVYLVVTSGASSQILPVSTAGAHVLRTGSLLYVDGTVVADSVGSVSVCASAGSPRPTVSTGSASGWVDYYAGWRLPSQSGLSWTPGHLTRSVSMDVRISGGQTLTLAPAGVGPAMVTRTDGGMVGVSASESSAAALGSYDWVRVTVDADGLYVFEGIVGDPTRATGTAVTSMSYQASGSGELYPTVSMSYNGSSPVVYVESAAIYAGSYAVARDALIDMGALYPGWSDWKIQIAAGASPSPGASIDVGGNSCAVDADARTLTVGGTVVSIDNLAILRAGGHLYIAGIDLGASDVHAVTLGGSWVAAVTASQMTERTEVAHDWAPGMFAASSELFGAIGILMCIVTFVGLSLVGRRSAVKTIALAGVCGFAAYILYLVMRMRKTIFALIAIAAVSAVALVGVSQVSDDSDASSTITIGVEYRQSSSDSDLSGMPANEYYKISAGQTIALRASSQVPYFEGTDPSKPGTYYLFDYWDVGTDGLGSLGIKAYPGQVFMEKSFNYNTKYRLVPLFSLYAHYIISFDANGGAGGPGALDKTIGWGDIVKGGVVLPSETPARDGYTFAGWSLTADGQATYQPAERYQSAEANGYNHAPTLYAVWSKDPVTAVTVTVTYSVADPMHNPPPTKTISVLAGDPSYSITVDRAPDNSGSLVEWPGVHEGAYFAGWSDGQATYQPGDTIAGPWSEDTTIALTAVQLTGYRYIISFDANGGADAPEKLVSWKPADGAVLPSETPARDGYTFAGWALTADGPAAYQPGETYVAQSSVGWGGYMPTLYAVWTYDGYSYTLAFHAPGADNVPGAMTVRGSSAQLRALVPSTVPSMDGMRFLGWSLTDGGSVRYQPGGSIVMTGDTALYAVWTPATASPAGIGEEEHGAPAAIDRIADALGVSGAVVGMALLLAIWAAALAVMHNSLGTRRGGAYALVPMALGALALVALGAIDAALGVLIAAISILMTAVTVKTAAA